MIIQCNISSQYYHRILQSQIKEPVIEEMHQLTEEFQNDKLEFIKNPMIVEFLGLSEDAYKKLSRKEHIHLSIKSYGQ